MESEGNGIRVYTHYDKCQEVARLERHNTGLVMMIVTISGTDRFQAL